MFLAETGPTGRIPLAIRLVGRNGVAGAVIVGLIALVYLVGIPALDAALRGPAIDASRVTSSSGISVVPPEGWAYDPDSETFQVFTQAGATIIVAPALPSDGTLEEAVAPTQEQLASDEGGQWVVSEPQYFTTRAGDRAVLLAAQNPTDAQLLWIVEHEGWHVRVVMNAPAASLETAFGSAQELVESMRIQPGGAP
ncbi:hypothetical protein [Demequina zhanjiangensis]|uniref:DUF4245 domain-containing protein n=1 Tax=Demequina zhanjiangensis TaxID=3051659 RepID=A0ABT8FZB0_9MICO|nr:hypothetical protein [Demequina sp. SYSU T00b26]MDN4472223.1 hypothetical protein [Demequina sp. SYSU T00b26]